MYFEAVRVCIHASLQPNRIALDISSDCRVVIAGVVVIQAGLRILVLPRKARIVVEGAKPCRVLVGNVVSERTVVPSPDILLAGVLDDVRGAEPVGAHGIDGCAGGAGEDRDGGVDPAIGIGAANE